jgi:pimeloyl-[acyl-carrier protein] methyl ester esterase
LDGTGVLFEPFIEALGPEIRTLVVRYSRQASRTDEYTACEDIARAVLPAEEPYVLLGESFSGPIALSIAASWPPGLGGVVLVASFAVNPRPELAWLKPLIRVLPTHHSPGWVSRTLLTDPFTTPSLTRLLDSAQPMVTPGAMKARLRAIFSIDARAQVPHIRVPILYLRGSSDRLVRADSSQLIAQLASHVQVVDCAAPHCLLQCAPAAAAEAVRGFFETLNTEPGNSGSVPVRHLT